MEKSVRHGLGVSVASDCFGVSGALSCRYHALTPRGGARCNKPGCPSAAQPGVPLAEPQFANLPVEEPMGAVCNQRTRKRSRKTPLTRGGGGGGGCEGLRGALTKPAPLRCVMPSVLPCRGCGQPRRACWNGLPPRRAGQNSFPCG